MPIDRNGGQYITANPQQPTQSSAPGIWDIDEQGSAQAAGRWPLPPNVVQRSLRFNSADSAYLSRTPAAAGNRQTWTYSVWIKRGKLGSAYELFTSGTNVVTGPAGQITLRASDDLRFVSHDGSTLQADLISTQVFRDPSAWYHLVFSVDTTQGTSSNRIKIYVNGTQITAFGTATYPSQNANLTWNQAQLQGLFTNVTATNGSSYFDGYGAEINFVDGQALTPSSFGQTDAQTGQWIPQVYSGSYGTNGFRLQFLDNSGTTATTLGKDTSGRGNNWTPSGSPGFSVAAGSGNDSLRDVPMNYYSPDNGLGGEVIGNYCTFSPINSSTSPLNGNLDVSAVSCAFGATMGFSSGKWYFEFTKNANGDNQLGIVTGTAISATGGGTLMFRRMWRDGSGSPTWVSDNATAGAGTPVSASVGDVIAIALDMDNNAVYFAKNNVWMNGGIPTSGSAKSGAIWTDLGSYSNWGVYAGAASTGVYASLNCGQRPFAYTAPSGFKALCTQNLSAPRIGNVAVSQANDYFNTVLYNGTGATQSITGVGFQSDFLWIKGRGVDNHNLHNSIVGAAAWLSSDTTGAEQSNSAVLTSFDADGFTVGSNPSSNASGMGFVAWCWNAGGSTVTNTSGSITSSVRANQTSGFSVVTYTGTGSAATIGHGLGAAPSMIIVKSRTSSVRQWPVYHVANRGTTGSINPQSSYIYLNLTNSAPSSPYSGFWNDTAPTSTFFSVGTDGGTNANTENFVAYCFAAVPGFSAFGSYTGNGSADGPFVYLGFRPKWIMIKPSSTTGNWTTIDTARDLYNLSNKTLYPDLPNAEETAYGPQLDVVSNGFKFRNGPGYQNNSGATYIYAAFAEIPFQFANAR